VSRAVRVGLVGCGRLAEAGYLPALVAASGVQLAAVADPDPLRRTRLAARSGLPVTIHTDAAELLDRADIDAVILASPAAAHLGDAKLAADAGIPTLVEKPPAPDLATAAEVAALVPPPWIGFNRRFDPGARVARDAVPASGPVELGLGLSFRRPSWRAYTVHDDALLDVGPHLVDWVRWLTGTEVTEVTTRQLSDDRAQMTLTTSRGSAHLAVAADRLHAEHLAVRDGGGRLVARHRVGGPVAAVLGRLRPGPHPLVTSLTAQVEAFAAAVRGEPAPDLATAADGRAVMAVLDAVRASAAAGGQPTAVPMAVVA
jgi:predicted dehydrogenase